MNGPETTLADEAALPMRAMNTVLYCENFAQTLAFYDDVLRLPRGFSKDWFVEFQVAREAYLSIADRRRASIDSARGAGLTLTFQVADVRVSYQQLRARGASPSAVGPRPWGSEGFLLHDPEGTRIEIWAPSLARP